MAIQLKFSLLFLMITTSLCCSFSIPNGKCTVQPPGSCIIGGENWIVNVGNGYCHDGYLISTPCSDPFTLCVQDVGDGVYTNYVATDCSYGIYAYGYINCTSPGSNCELTFKADIGPSTYDESFVPITLPGIASLGSLFVTVQTSSHCPQYEIVFANTYYYITTCVDSPVNNYSFYAYYEDTCALNNNPFQPTLTCV